MYFVGVFKKKKKWRKFEKFPTRVFPIESCDCVRMETVSENNM